MNRVFSGRERLRMLRFRAQTPAVATAEEACPDEKTMIEDDDFEEEASESSSLHEVSSLSGSGSDSSSLSKGSSSVVADRSGDELLGIQTAACLPCTSSQERCGCS